MGEQLIQLIKNLAKSKKLSVENAKDLIDLSKTMGWKPVLEEITKMAPEEVAQFQKQIKTEQYKNLFSKQIAQDVVDLAAKPGKTAKESAKAFESKDIVPTSSKEIIPVDLNPEPPKFYKKNIPDSVSDSSKEITPYIYSPEIEPSVNKIDKSKILEADYSLGELGKPRPRDILSPESDNLYSSDPLFGGLGKFIKENPKTAMLLGAGGANLASKMQKDDQEKFNEEMNKTSSSVDKDNQEEFNKMMNKTSSSLDNKQEENLLPKKSQISNQIKEVSGAEPKEDLNAEIIKKYVDADKADQRQDYLAGLREAQKAGNLQELFARLGSAGQTISSAVAQSWGGKAFDDSMFKSMIEEARTSPQRYIQEQQYKREQEMYDPNSPISQAHQAFAKHLNMPPQLYVGKSAADLKALNPFIEKIAASRERASELEQRRAELSEQKATRQKIEEEYKARSELERRQRSAIGGRGGQALTAAKTRIQNAQNIFSTVGVDPDISEKDVSSLSTDLLNKIDRTRVAEIGIELNKLYAGSAAPSQKTLEKLLPDNEAMIVSKWKDWFTNKLNPAQQSEFLRTALKAAARGRDLGTKQAYEIGKQHFAGTQKLRKILGDEYDQAVSQTLNIPKEEVANLYEPTTIKKSIKEQQNKDESFSDIPGLKIKGQ